MKTQLLTLLLLFGSHAALAVEPAGHARAVGEHMGHAVPPALRAKLPMEFRQPGNSVHRDFDQMALNADTLGDVSHSLTQLSTTLQKCVSCHATYQIRTPGLDTQRLS